MIDLSLAWHDFSPVGFDDHIPEVIVSVCDESLDAANPVPGL